ncbi:MAG: RNA polymerase subunit sigma-70, partial [Myxococcales bacterium]|nr:RNA polymerase subunit sigma-70 [Myxococcales bacterium]
MTQAEPDDHALLHAWQQGDAAAGERLMRRHYDAIHRFFEVKASFLADDLTQRTFLACMEAAASYRGESSVRAFLFGIARKQYLGYQRKDGRLESAMQFRDFGGRRTFTSVSTLVSRREEQHLLLRALVDLPAEQLMPLQLF